MDQLRNLLVGQPALTARSSLSETNYDPTDQRSLAH